MHAFGVVLSLQEFEKRVLKTQPSVLMLDPLDQLFPLYHPVSAEDLLEEVKNGIL